jgi:hypothetical protein
MLDRKTRLIFESILEGKRKPALRPSRIEEDDDDDDDNEGGDVGGGDGDGDNASNSPTAGDQGDDDSSGEEEPSQGEPSAQEPEPTPDPYSSIDWENVKFIGTGGIARYQEIGDDDTKEVNLSRFSKLKPDDLKQAKSLLRQIDVLSYLASDAGNQAYASQVPENKRLDINNLRKALIDSGLYSEDRIRNFDVNRKSLLNYARTIEGDEGKKQKIIDAIKKIQNAIGNPLSNSPETVQFVKNLTSGGAGSIFNLRSNKSWKTFIELVNSFYGEPTALDIVPRSGGDEEDDIEENKQIVIDLSRNNGVLNESFVSMFSYWIKKIIQHFLDGIHIPVKVIGSERDVEAFARALSSEKNFLMKAQKYGLTDKRTYSSKYELDKAVNGFQKETGIRWPFK